MSLISRRSLSVAVLAASIPGSIFVACGNATFSAGSTSTDASFETSTVSDTPDGGSWCQLNVPTANACADFDRGDSGDVRNGYLRDVPTLVFLGQNVDDAGTIGLRAGGDSLPNAFGSEIPTLAASQPVQETISASLNGNGSKHFAFGVALRFDAIDDISSATPVTICALTLATPGVNPSNTTFALRSYNSALHAEVLVGGASTAGLNLGPIPATDGSWTAMTFDVDLGVAGSFTASLGGTSQNTPIHVDQAQSTPTVVLGLQSPGGTGNISVSYDNVALTTTN